MLLRRLIISLLLLTCVMMSYGQTNTQIKAVFRKFQEGYVKRDTSVVEKFAAEICTKDIQVTGVGVDEWFQGIEAAKNLFKNNWAYWLSLKLDTTSFSLTTAGSTAFFMLRGTASITFPSKEAAYDFALGRLEQLVSNEKTNRTKLFAYASQAADLVQQIESGSLEITYSIRLTGGLIKETDRWLFKQLVFAFPYPMSRQ